MAKIIGKSDRALELIMAQLEQYESKHPGSNADLYRQNPAAIRIRVVDPSFADRDRVERDEVVWQFLKKIPSDARNDITVVLLLAPDEVESSFANHDFEKPVPSRL